MGISWYNKGMEIIYSLKDPSTGEVRYIGKTHGTPAKRLWQHMHSAKQATMKQRKLASWIRSLGGACPIIEVLETDPPDLDYTEKAWIAVGRYCGLRLTNMTDGGDGRSPGYIPSEESRRKNSEAHQGRVKSEEERRRISKALIGHEVSEETRQKIGDGNRGKRRTEEVRAAISTRISGEGNPFFGKTHTKEAKEKMSRLGWKHSEETKVHLSETNQKFRHSEETKERMRQARQTGIQARFEAGLPARGPNRRTESQT